MTVDSDETLGEAREAAMAEAQHNSEWSRVKAVVFALLYIGDCIRSLTDREQV